MHIKVIFRHIAINAPNAVLQHGASNLSINFRSDHVPLLVFVTVRSKAIFLRHSLMAKNMAIIKDNMSTPPNIGTIKKSDYRSSIAFALTASVFILSQYWSLTKHELTLWCPIES